MKSDNSMVKPGTSRGWHSTVDAEHSFLCDRALSTFKSAPLHTTALFHCLWLSLRSAGPTSPACNHIPFCLWRQSPWEPSPGRGRRVGGIEGRADRARWEGSISLLSPQALTGIVRLFRQGEGSGAEQYVSVRARLTCSLENKSQEWYTSTLQWN